MRVVLLERGPQLNVKDFQLHDEMISNSKGHLFPAFNGLDHRHPREFRHTPADSFQKIFPEDGYYPLLAAVVGGGQLFYGA